MSCGRTGLSTTTSPNALVAPTTSPSLTPPPPMHATPDVAQGSPPAAVGVARQAQVADAELRGARVAVDVERGVLVAEEARGAAVEAAIDVAPQLLEREHVVLVVVLRGDDGAEARERQRRIEAMPRP